MRDPRRIRRVLTLLEHYWNANPDLRLGQILGNASLQKDAYHYEDTDFEAWLKSRLADSERSGA